MDENGVENSSGFLVKRRVKRASEDRISKLPDSIIVHILSFLPTPDVVPTCLLSKRWKLMWYSVPKLYLSDNDWSPEKFFNYVDSFLEHRKKGMYFIVDSVITSFQLHMDCYHTSKATRLDKWLTFAVENKVKEIHLNLNFCDEGGYYCIPKLVVNSKDLVILELVGLTLKTCYSVRLPALKTLSLTYVYFEENDAICNFLWGCPSLEKLLLSSCDLIEIGDVLRLQSISLKFMKIEYEDCVLYTVLPIQVEAINLECLELERPIFESSNLSTCKAIRNLSLDFCGLPMKDEDPSSLEYLISNLPLLEILTLKNSHILKLEHIKISNQRLRSLNLKNRWYTKDDYEMNVIIESAPQLVSFCYEGNINFSISTESSNLLNGKFIILPQHDNYDANWFTSLMNFLLNLNCSWNIVTLHVMSDKVIILPKKFKRMCQSPLLNWKHLSVITDQKPERESDLEDVLIWISLSLETLSINGKIIF
ncbi:F-box/FBD/LRR-repeat protein At2g26030-like [Humulus lupulus]|uniref:F-box/FBD/LRR-repeat protein At2g26030-like n=1 Tax=Humulus lupulus TaxID=3486 RepID=UPI002B407DEC|nr:F-box/FBD/LRR-repeat protein At2g26030-like [Humulus lupulus]